MGVMCDSQQLIDLSGELDHSADTGVFKVQSFYHCEVGNVFFIQILLITRQIQSTNSFEIFDMWDMSLAKKIYFDADLDHDLDPGIIFTEFLLLQDRGNL